jgi:hypothetical protein
MKKKKISEQVLGGAELQVQSPRLQTAVREKCFPDGASYPVKDELTGKEAVYRKATTEAYKNNPHIFFFEDGTKEYRTTADKNGKVALTKKWFCPAIEKKIDPAQTPIQQDAFGQLEDDGYKYWSQVSGSQTRNYELVNLQDTKNLPDNLQVEPYLSQFKQGPFYMWKERGLKQKAQSKNTAGQGCIDDYKTKYGYIDASETPIPQTDPVEIIDLAKECPRGGFSGTYTMWRSIAGIGASQIEQKLSAWYQNPDKDTDTKSWCRNGITLYYQAYSKKTQLDPSVVKNYKNSVLDCINQGFKYPLLKKEIGQLEAAAPITLPNGTKLRYGLYDKRDMNEGVEKQLQKVIRENLISIQQNKKKVLTEESKIVKNRFKIIGEGRTFKTKSDVRKFSDELINEMVYLNSQGFDKQVINEGFWDVLSGLFPKGMDSIFDTFKERGVAWLMEKLGLNPDSWLGSVVVTGLGDIDIVDVPKLFSDCNFATKALSKAIAEGTVRQLQQKYTSDSAIADVLRNTVVEVLSETELGQKLESSIGSLICPLISNLSGKLKDAAGQITDKAVGAAEDTGIMKSLS